MSLAQPLSPRLDLLRERLAAARPLTGDGDASRIWAAVALILVPAPDAMLLIRRAERQGDPWSGHMALPGGRQEPPDRDLTATAIRETAEEVGLRLSPADLIGGLDDVIPRTPMLPPIAVRPFVFTLPARPPLAPNPEVASAGWVLLDHLLHPETYHSARVEIRGAPRDFPAYRVEDSIVWGMTERIVTSLLDHFRA
ncbi:MAG: NUDIX hydrolase [Gemmatimonadales bacterium]